MRKQNTSIESKGEAVSSIFVKAFSLEHISSEPIMFWFPLKLLFLFYFFDLNFDFVFRILFHFYLSVYICLMLLFFYFSLSIFYLLFFDSSLLIFWTSGWYDYANTNTYTHILTQIHRVTQKSHTKCKLGVWNKKTIDAKKNYGLAVN